MEGEKLTSRPPLISRHRIFMKFKLLYFHDIVLDSTITFPPFLYHCNCYISCDDELLKANVPAHKQSKPLFCRFHKLHLRLLRTIPPYLCTLHILYTV